MTRVQQCRRYASRACAASFGTVQALDGLDLDLAPGELVALLGPSGCGKTTALRILAGLEDADSGRIVVGGKDVANVPANRRDMGMVFQAYSLFPHLTATGERRVRAAPAPPGRGRPAAQRAREMLELVGIGAHADRYPQQLSGGQQQRVALARALAIQPQVLLLDEPLSALDAKVRVQLREEIRRIQLEVGTTTLFVTHDQEEALAIADRVGVMRDGRLEQIGSPEDIYRSPATPFVAEFVGLSNRLPGRVTDDVVEVLDAKLPLVAGDRRPQWPGHGAGPPGVGRRDGRPGGNRPGPRGELPRPDGPGHRGAARRHARRRPGGQRPAARAAAGDRGAGRPAAGARGRLGG